MTKHITSIDVARRAGVSQSTVSRVFSDKHPAVSAETRQRVLTAAADLGYRPNAIARMMSTRRTHIVGILMANITSPFYPYVLEKFLQRLQALDRQALVFTASAHQDVDALLPLVLQHQVAALIVTSATLSSETADECARSGVPVILFNRYVRGGAASAVCADNVAGGRLAADVLLDTGHRRLAYIAGTPDTSTNTDRERGFADRLAERGDTSWRRAQADYTYETGFAAAHDLLAGSDPPDALFCANDIMALGALDAVRQIGARVPEDVSIIGFDDIPMAGWGAYHLTTIRQEVDAMIAATLDLLHAKLDQPDSPPVLRLIPGSLIVRGSVRGLDRTQESGA
ncbi:MAG: substrate-binding domain-containing protein [Chloroflexi bacterium]|nr:substrate-binding domain-containing protein [Chloroflexota bacterium]